jgi:hypothetical protein
MSTCQAIVRRALRAMGVLQAGQQPTGSDGPDGLERLQGIVLALPGLTQGGFWGEHAASTAYTAKEGQRITVTGSAVITLPLIVTHHAHTRPPRDLAKVQIIGASVANPGTWLYSATKGAWGRANSLALSDELPFGAEDDEGLSALLAVAWADEFGPTAVIGARTLALAGLASRSFAARLKKAQAEDWSRPHDFHTSRRCGDYA